MAKVQTFRDREIWVGYVLRNPRLTPGCKCTAMALATHLNLSTGQLNPSMGRLAKATAQSVSVVEKHIRQLVEAGLLVRNEAGGHGGRHSNQYSLFAPHDGEVLTAATPHDGEVLTAATPHDGASQPHTTVRVNIEENIKVVERERASAPPAPKTKPPVNFKRSKTAPDHVSALPDNFPGPEERENANAFWTSVGREDLHDRIGEESQLFRNNALANGRTSQNWGATWSTWCHRAAARPPQASSRLGAAFAGARAFAQDERQTAPESDHTAVRMIWGTKYAGAVDWLIGKIGMAKFLTWFTRSTLTARSEGDITLWFPNTTARDWVAKAFSREVEAAFGQASIRLELAPRNAGSCQMMEAAA